MNSMSLEIHMGWKIERSAGKMCFGFLLSPWHLKNSMRRWTNTKHGPTYPFLILACQLHSKSVYHVPKYEPPWCAPPHLITCSLHFFSIRSIKIASYFKEMQILAFSHSLGSRQTIFTRNSERFTLGTVILIWPSLVCLVMTDKKRRY